MASSSPVQRPRGFFQLPADLPTQSKTSTNPAVKSREFFQTPAEAETASSAILGLAAYSFFLLTVPIAVYFLTQGLLQDYDLDKPYDALGGGIAAVFSVNIIIMLYVYKAFKINKEENKFHSKKD